MLRNDTSHVLIWFNTHDRMPSYFQLLSIIVTRIRLFKNLGIFVVYQNMSITTVTGYTGDPSARVLQLVSLEWVGVAQDTHPLSLVELEVVALAVTIDIVTVVDAPPL